MKLTSMRHCAREIVCKIKSNYKNSWNSNQELINMVQLLISVSDEPLSRVQKSTTQKHCRTLTLF